MFKELSNLMTERDTVNMVITKVNGKLSVSVLPKRKELKDEAKENLSPIVVTGTPEELDAEFTRALVQPLQKAIGLYTDMETFEKSYEATKAASKAATEAKKKTEMELKAFTDKMKTVESLVAEKKFAEAAILLKTVNEMPGANPKQCEILKSKIDVELNNGTLFA